MKTLEDFLKDDGPVKTFLDRWIQENGFIKNELKIMTQKDFEDLLMNNSQNFQPFNSAGMAREGLFGLEYDEDDVPALIIIKKV